MTEHNRQSTEAEHPQSQPATQPGDPGAAAMQLANTSVPETETTVAPGTLADIDRRILELDRLVDGLMTCVETINRTIALQNSTLAKLMSEGNA